MPCYQVRTISVSFSVGNTDLLKKALEKMGAKSIDVRNDKVIFELDYKYHEIDLANSKLNSRSIRDEKELGSFSNSIKRAYSECVIDEVAKKQRWIKKKMGENRFQLQRF